MLLRRTECDRLGKMLHTPRRKMASQKITVFQSTDEVEFTGRFYTETPKKDLPDNLANGHRVVLAQEIVYDPSGVGSFANEDEVRTAGFKKVKF
jgi:hypothetical protein